MLSAERYQQIKHICDQALDLSLPEREAFLTTACSGDPELRREVDSLLDAEQAAGDFIEGTALESLAGDLARERQAKLLGRRFGRYELKELLGVGGMGEVYRAFDSDLERDVAIKVLPPEYVADPRRVSLFEKEARTISALNHPNIITIHEIARFGQLCCLVTEFIDGVTLRERILEGLKGPELVTIAVQIAQALETAHSNGIVHRDLKPENVMIRRDGLVKVLDFGLAKLARDAHLTSLGPAVPGRVEGTVPYMSPEQASGQNVDHRTDIFSFGIILYEMVAGHRPFQGSENSSISDEIIHGAPRPLRVTGDRLPARLGRLTSRALEKRPEDRCSDFAEIRQELTLIQRESQRELAWPSGRRGWGLALAASLAAALLFFAALVYWGRPSSDGRVIGSAGFSNASFSRLTSGSALELSPSLSPNGDFLVYASDESGNWDIYLRRLDRAEIVNLTKDCAANDRHPSVSPDGSSVAFRSEREDGGIFIIDLTSREVRRISSEGHNPVWSPDGRELAYASAEVLNPSARGEFPSSLHAVSLQTGEKRLITEGDAVQPSWSPRGGWIAYWGLHQGGQRDIWIIPAQGGKPVEITDDAAVDWNPVWSPDGQYLYFASDRRGRMNLWRLPIDLETGSPIGELERVTIPAASSWYISFSGNGKKMAFVEAVNRTRLTMGGISLEKGELISPLREITSGEGVVTNPDLSPDQRWIVFDNLGDAQEDLFLVARDGSGLHRLTRDPFKDRSPRWNPRGDQILFFSDRSGRYELWTIRPDGSDLKQLTKTEGPGSQAAIWSPDGTRILENRQWGLPTLLRLDASGRVISAGSISTPEGESSDFLYWSWSPDGTRLAGWNSRKPGVFVYDFDTGRVRQALSFGERPVWLPDSRRLFYCSQGTLYLLDTVSGGSKEVFDLRDESFQSVSLSRDGRQIYASLTRFEADIWLAE